MTTSRRAYRPSVTTGIERVIADPSLLGGGRVGLVTNFTAVTAQLDRTIDALVSVDVSVVALFGPEHGLNGSAQAGASEKESIDEATGLAVVDTYLMEPETLDDKIRAANLDVLVYDMQDVGARYWTYTWTMFDCMAAAARTGTRFVVLDRPNPIGGVAVEGPGLDPAFASFVGRIDIPLRHGLTSGELARLFVTCEASHGVPMPELHVVDLVGWEDRRPFSATGLPWIAPSPNLPTLDTAFVYPATGLLEGTNVSEGRGTTKPFETLGAPFVDAKLLPYLRNQDLPGVSFRDTWFQPTFHKYAGASVRGVAIHVTDPADFAAVRTGVTILSAMATLYPNDFCVLEPTSDEPGVTGFAIDRLWGSDRLRTALEQHDVARLDALASEPAAAYPSEKVSR
jgi:uncharacterized protein YbbC (DUF1343 family)